MKKLLIGVLVLRMENGWIQPFQNQFTIPTMAFQGMVVDVMDIMGANVLRTAVYCPPPHQQAKPDDQTLP